MSNFDQELDDVTMSTLGLDEEDAKAFRLAVMNLAYEDLFKPLFQRHEEFKNAVFRFFYVTVALQLILIAILLMMWTW